MIGVPGGMVSGGGIGWPGGGGQSGGGGGGGYSSSESPSAIAKTCARLILSIFLTGLLKKLTNNSPANAQK